MMLYLYLNKNLNHTRRLVTMYRYPGMGGKDNAQHCILPGMQCVHYSLHTLYTNVHTTHIVYQWVHYTHCTLMCTVHNVQCTIMYKMYTNVYDAQINNSEQLFILKFSNSRFLFHHI